MDPSRLAAQIAKKLLGDPHNRAKLYATAKRFVGQILPNGGQSLGGAAAQWKKNLSDPKLREAMTGKIFGFIAVNFMGIMFFVQMLDGLYKTWQRSRQQRDHQIKIQEQRKLEQERSRAATKTKAPQVGTAADQVTWATQRGAGWAMADGGLLTDYTRQNDPLERSVIASWLTTGTDEVSTLSAPSAVDPLYGIVARTSALLQ